MKLKSQWQLLLVGLLVISVSTLVQAIVSEDHKVIYAVATTMSHIALVVVGTTYVRGPHARRRKSNHT